MCSGAWVWDRVYHKPIVRDVTPCSSDVFRQENYYSGYARGLRCKSGLVCLGFFLTQNRDSCAIVLRHILPSLNPLWFHAYSFIPKCQLREEWVCSCSCTTTRAWPASVIRYWDLHREWKRNILNVIIHLLFLAVIHYSSPIFFNYSLFIFDCKGN